MNKEHENLCPLSNLYPLLAGHFHLLSPTADGIQMYLQVLIFVEWSLKLLCILVQPLSNSYSVNFKNSNSNEKYYPFKRAFLP